MSCSCPSVPLPRERFDAEDEAVVLRLRRLSASPVERTSFRFSDDEDRIEIVAISISARRDAHCWMMGSRSCRRLQDHRISGSRRRRQAVL